MTSEASDLVLQRSLEIRKSVESAVLDLEQEVIRCQTFALSSPEENFLMDALPFSGKRAEREVLMKRRTKAKAQVQRKRRRKSR